MSARSRRRPIRPPPVGQRNRPPISATAGGRDESTATPYKDDSAANSDRRAGYSARYRGYSASYTRAHSASGRSVPVMAMVAAQASPTDAHAPAPTAASSAAP